MAEKKETLRDHPTEATARVDVEELEESGVTPPKQSSKSRREGSQRKHNEGDGARVRHRYHDRTEDTIAVTHDDLREVRDLGANHQILFGTGIFFFSGAFWELVRLITEQTKFEFTAWMGMYIVSIVAGAILAGVGAYLFHSKQLRLNKYFVKMNDASEGNSGNSP
jgi:hypothetical protein